MKDPDWGKVLEFLYKNKGSNKYEVKNDNTDNLNPLQLKERNLENMSSKIDGIEDIRDLYDYLVDTGLVRSESGANSYAIYLTRKGFDVAHEREITKSQQETNRRSARLSGYLVVAIITQSLIAVTQLEGGREVIMISLVILGLALVVLIELNEDHIRSLADKVRSRF